MMILLCADTIYKERVDVTSQILHLITINILVPDELGVASAYMWSSQIPSDDATSLQREPALLISS